MVRRLPIMFSRLVAFLLECHVGISFHMPGRKVLISEICTCFLRIWNFFASPQSALTFPINMLTYLRHQERVTKWALSQILEKYVHA